VFGQLMGQRDEDFSGILGRVSAWFLGVFSEAEGAELVGDGLDGGFGERLSVGGRAPNEELGFEERCG
jgi:hypothetical protein